MKGNQPRRGAVSKSGRGGSKGKKGSGGKRKRALSGKGPTPKAQDRTYHVAYRRKVEGERRRSHAVAQEKRQRYGAINVEEGNELVVGRNAVEEAAKLGVKIHRIYLAGDLEGQRIKQVVNTLSTVGAPFVEVTRRDLEKVSEGAAHQGVAVEIAGYEYWDLEDLMFRATEKVEPGLLVALDHVTDPHNVGAVLRSAAAFGADGMVLPERRSAAVGVTAWKVSAGAAATVPTARVTNLVQALRKLKENGFFVVGLDGNADQEVGEMTLATVPLVLVVGAEGAGLSRLVRETCDLIVSIPTTEKVESLNAAVAAGITLYQVHQLRCAASQERVD